MKGVVGRETRLAATGIALHIPGWIRQAPHVLPPLSPFTLMGGGEAWTRVCDKCQRIHTVTGEPANVKDRDANHNSVHALFAVRNPPLSFVGTVSPSVSHLDVENSFPAAHPESLTCPRSFSACPFHRRDSKQEPTTLVA